MTGTFPISVIEKGGVSMRIGVTKDSHISGGQRVVTRLSEERQKKRESDKSWLLFL